MAVFTVRFITLATLAITGIIIFGNNGVLGQACQGDMQGLITQCAAYVQKTGPKINPSQSCCNVIKTVNVPCVCGQITKQIEKMVDMEKVVFIAEYCGMALQHGTKCGSYTVP